MAAQTNGVTDWAAAIIPLQINCATSKRIDSLMSIFSLLGQKVRDGFALAVDAMAADLDHHRHLHYQYRHHQIVICDIIHHHLK